VHFPILRTLWAIQRMTQHYNLWLVALSLAVGSLASYAMLEVALRVRDASGRGFRYWLIGGSTALGFGVWSTHFIGMLAHSVHLPVGYDFALTLLSIVPAVVAAALTLCLFRRRVDLPGLVLLGGLSIGVGIASMHYVGMAALKMSPSLQYDPMLFALSWLIAIAAATVSLAMGKRLRGSDRPTLAKKLAAALMLGLAIAGMHYTGMAATSFAPGSVSLALGVGLDKTALAVGLGLVTLLVVILLIVIFDARIAAERMVARELKHMALHDQLTGLANRELFHEQLCSALHRTSRQTTLLAVLAINLDGFKEINDLFGHKVGDRLLVDVARRLKRGMRREDLVARLSGDQFIAMAADMASPGQAAFVAQRLLDELNRAEGESGIAVRASIGISLYPQDGNTAGELLKQADFALYRAKADGKGCHHFYNATVEHAVRAQQQRLEELKLAIARDELTVFYQPQVNTSTRAVVGVEALVRWRHPIEGMLAPGAFIPLAEGARMMPLLDAWVIRKACTDAAQWSTLGIPLRIGINVSAQSIDLDLVAVVADALQQSGLPAELLELEITETGLLTAGEKIASKALHQLSGLGVQLSIDDFGTGYGSLTYLSTLPIDAIKIDRQFVQAALQERPAAAIVASLIDLARNLDLRVVSEGVETAAQLDFLLSSGCDVAQGYWFSRPLPLREFGHFIGAESAPEVIL